MWNILRKSDVHTQSLLWWYNIIFLIVNLVEEVPVSPIWPIFAPDLQILRLCAADSRSRLSILIILPTLPRTDIDFAIYQFLTQSQTFVNFYLFRATRIGWSGLILRIFQNRHIKERRMYINFPHLEGGNQYPARATVWHGFWFRGITGPFFFKKNDHYVIWPLLSEYFFTKIEEEDIDKLVSTRRHYRRSYTWPSKLFGGFGIDGLFPIGILQCFID